MTHQSNLLEQGYYWATQVVQDPLIWSSLLLAWCRFHWAARSAIDAIACTAPQSDSLDSRCKIPPSPIGCTSTYEHRRTRLCENSCTFLGHRPGANLPYPCFWNTRPPCDGVDSSRWNRGHLMFGHVKRAVFSRSSDGRGTWPRCLWCNRCWRDSGDRYPFRTIWHAILRWTESQRSHGASPWDEQGRCQAYCTACGELDYQLSWVKLSPNSQLSILPMRSILGISTSFRKNHPNANANHLCHQCHTSCRCPLGWAKR